MNGVIDLDVAARPIRVAIRGPRRIDPNPGPNRAARRAHAREFSDRRILRRLVADVRREAKHAGQVARKHAKWATRLGLAY